MLAEEVAFESCIVVDGIGVALVAVAFSTFV
jgi:hypothetical protein